MAELNMDVIKNCVKNALNEPIIEGKSIVEWATIGLESQHWISVKERVPEDVEDVLVYIEHDSWAYGANSAQRKREIAIGYFICGHWHADGFSNVVGICWMPLPKPPREVNKNALN